VTLDPAQHRDIVVIGASAGGVEALRELVGGLPADLAAALMVVLHTPSGSQGNLPEVLGRAGRVEVSFPRDGDAVTHGTIAVAPPDHHLLVDGAKLRLVRGPRENGVRPAIDPLFRTAAHSYGPRVMGVVLSGALDDGAAGLREIERVGGVTIVQDPDEALVPSMPLAALRAVSVHYVASVQRIAKLIVQLSEGALPRETREPESRAAEPADPEELQGIRPAPPAAFICPECGGSLADLSETGIIRFACHVGHTFGSDSLLAHHETALERALWTALRTLEESAALRREMATRALQSGLAGLERAYLERAAELEQRADVIRGVVERDVPEVGAEWRAREETEAPDVP
jgi:two-component system chemotaxis response regulator CheB